MAWCCAEFEKRVLAQPDDGFRVGHSLKVVGAWSQHTFWISHTPLGGPEKGLLLIKFCPWCGTKLPETAQDELTRSSE